jgi:hypothetical protein
MTGPIANVGDLAKPVTALINKVAAALGGYFRPHQIRRVAQAEADAAIIRATADLQITELQRRALQRVLAEESRNQANIESITDQALPQLTAGATPEAVSDDWIVNFFDKARLVSEEEMQKLWARVLSGEANAPGTFSKRTVDYLGSIDKTDASAFAALCRFTVVVDEPNPFIYNSTDRIYTDTGFSFSTAKHLADIGLITLEGTHFHRIGGPLEVKVTYGPEVLSVIPAAGRFSLGHALFTRVGRELSTISQVDPVPGFTDYLITSWRSQGVRSAKIRG